ARCDEVCHCPEHDTDEHRMLKRAFDTTGKVRGNEKRKHRKHENGGDVLSPGRWHVQHHRIPACDAVAPDDEHQAGDRYQGIEASPCVAEAGGHSVAPGWRDDGYRMHPEE